MSPFIKSFRSFLARHRRGFIITGVIIGVLLGINALFFVSSQFPRSCLVCHYMEPFYKQWQTSSHNNVKCVKCHKFRFSFIYVTTLKYITGLYNPKPHAVIEDESCLNGECHTRESLKKKILFKNRILFDHSKHYGKFKRVETLRCVNCHSQIVQGQHITVSENVCFLCHFKDVPEPQAIGGCNACHGAPKETVTHAGFQFNHTSYLKIGVSCDQCHTKVKKSNGEVPEEKCYSCHVERKHEEPYRLHLIHVTQKNIYCFQCHTIIEHKAVQFTKPLEVKCATCHPEEHVPQKEIYMGVGAIGVTEVPSRMFAAQVSCEGCHGEGHKRAKTLKEKRQACVRCHGPRYDLMLDVWLSETARALRYVKGKLNQAESLLKHRKKVSPDALQMLKDAKHNYLLVKNGRGVHNPEYAVRVLSATLSQIEIAEKFTGIRIPRTVPPKVLSEPDGYCMKLCHSVLGLPKEIFFDEMKLEFPHAKHVKEVGLKCVTCHSPDKHKMRIITKEGCIKCHHEKEKQLPCSSCHHYQWNLYYGKFRVEGVASSPGEMAQGDVECLDCHRLDIPRVDPVEIRSKCVECHDESYADTFSEWEKEALKMSSDLLLKIGQLEEKLSLYEKVDPEKAKTVSTALQNLKKESNYILLGRPVHNHAASEEIYSRLSKALEKLSTELTR